MKLKILLLVLASTTFGAKLPSNFKQCKASDPNLNDCLKIAIEETLFKLKDGNLEINAIPLEPFVIPSVSIGEGNGAVHVVQNYKNLKLHHLSEVKVQEVKSTITADSWILETQVLYPQIVLEADYDFNGRILLLPIVGKGKCNIKLIDLKTILKLTTKTHELKGKTYLTVTEYHMKLEPGKVEYNFENLFNGDKRLGDEMNAVLNDNWHDVFNDVKPGYEEMFDVAFEDYLNKILGKVTFEDLFPL